MKNLIRPIPPEKVPDWLIYSLKSLLLVLLVWNLYQHWSFPQQSSNSSSLRAAKPAHVKEIPYNHSLDKSKPLITSYLKWGAQKVPLIDFEKEDGSLYAFSLSNSNFNKLPKDSFSLIYKGLELEIKTIHTLSNEPTSKPSSGPDSERLETYLHEQLAASQPAEQLWVAIETINDKIFFTSLSREEEHRRLVDVKNPVFVAWRDSLVSKYKYRNVDNLTVARPVFRNSEYRFRWGDFHAAPNNGKGGRRLKIGIDQLASWKKNTPLLFNSNDQFIPFSFFLRNWTVGKRDQYCSVFRLTEEQPAVYKNECFDELLGNIAVGDVLSLFIFVEKKDLLYLLPNEKSDFSKPFIINGEEIRLSFSIEIIGNPEETAANPLHLATSIFDFQLHTIPGHQPLIKMDTKNPKNQTLFLHYQETKSAKVVHIDHFQTVKRILTEEDNYLLPEETGATYFLTPSMFKTETFPEFYDFDVLPPKIICGGLTTSLDQVVQQTTDFDHHHPELKMWIGDESVKILQFTFTIVPENGKATRYITNQMDRYDIRKRLNKLNSKTSLYFDQILFERENGEQLLFPLTTALHLL